MTDYLDEFETLKYTMHENSIELSNLKSMNGMDVAELLTYLFDDGYTEFGPMGANFGGGTLVMLQ